MGYLKQGKEMAFFIRLTDEQVPEATRLLNILKRTKKRRIKNKLANRIDSMVKVSKYGYRVKPFEGIVTGSPNDIDYAGPIGNAVLNTLPKDTAVMSNGEAKGLLSNG